MTTPRTVWEEGGAVLSGSRFMVRGAAMPVGGAARGAVTLSARVPAGVFDVMDDGSVALTVLLNPDEARTVAAWLSAAATAADEAGPPLYEP